MISTAGQLIAHLMERNCLDTASSVVMIGDTHYDMIGALEQGNSSIAIGYGLAAINRSLQANLIIW